MVRMVLSICLLGLAGCEPLAISVLGAGAGAALRYGIDGVSYRTFTAPAPVVREASLAALERMGITLRSTDRFEGGEVLYANSDKRTIEIEVEPISAKATRVRIAAKNGGLFYDPATASEIIAQTERLLESAARGTSANF
jgi:DNA-binding transcriptional ArsR family regulator